jgi:HPt (histidine-containing phosphotransfer) domain-containing protein
MSLDFIDLESLQRYKSRRHADLIRCRECLKKRDYETIRTIGHNLKGNGTSFGFPELSSLGEKIENSARELNGDQIQKLVDSLEEWVHQQKFSI